MMRIVKYSLSLYFLSAITTAKSNHNIPSIDNPVTSTVGNTLDILKNFSEQLKNSIKSINPTAEISNVTFAMIDGQLTVLNNDTDVSSIFTSTPSATESQTIKTNPPIPYDPDQTTSAILNYENNYVVTTSPILENDISSMRTSDITAIIEPYIDEIMYSNIKIILVPISDIVEIPFVNNRTLEITRDISTQASTTVNTNSSLFGSNFSTLPSSTSPSSTQDYTVSYLTTNSIPSISDYTVSTISEVDNVSFNDSPPTITFIIPLEISTAKSYTPFSKALYNLSEKLAYLAENHQQQHEQKLARANLKKAASAQASNERKEKMMLRRQTMNNTNSQ